MLKYYILAIFWQFTKSLNHYCTYLRKTKIWKLAYLLDLSNWKNLRSLAILLLDNILINGYSPKRAEYHVRWKLVHLGIQFLYCHLEWNSYSKSFIFNSCTLSFFPVLEIKKLAFVGKILWRFDIIFHIWLIHLFCH